MMIGIETTDIDWSITLNVAGYIAHSVSKQICRIIIIIILILLTLYENAY